MRKKKMRTQANILIIGRNSNNIPKNLEGMFQMSLNTLLREEEGDEKEEDNENLK